MNAPRQANDISQNASPSRLLNDSRKTEPGSDPQVSSTTEMPTGQNVPVKELGFVYFVKPVDQYGPIKIGFSSDPAARLHNMSLGSPLELELIGAVPGTGKDEFFLHSCFADDHSHREWFKFSDRLATVIKEVLAAGSVDVVRNALQVVGGIDGRSGKLASEAQLKWRALQKAEVSA